MGVTPTFKDERFMSAQEKLRVYRAWERFLKNGCSKAQFTRELYHHFTQHCSFIAHYDRHGFYSVYFERITPQLFRFFDQFDPGKPGVSAEYGTTHWLGELTTGADLNHAMREAAGPYLPRLRQHFEEVRRQTDIAVARQLLAGYGLTVVAAVQNNPESVPVANACEHHHPIQPQLFAESL
jgi:hypothetical protein